jgi:dTDP-4-amino-4,6-dideoxygalactose transaminase
MIPIVKPYLPPLDKYQRYLEGIYQRNWLTNKGPLLQELEQRLADYLGVQHLMLVANGTLALQVAYRALGLEQGEVITTPFTFAATPGSLCWQNLEPNFVDIDADSLNLSVDSLTNEVLSKAVAITAVHVFGNPCEVEQIQDLAQTHNLKVIYDAAHAFGSTYKGESVLQYGDAATLSLHATKLFHCVEGGAIIFKDKAALDKARQLINFGFDNTNNPEFVGINAKMSELHAAMGLAMLDDIDAILEARQQLVARYHQQLGGVVGFQQWHSDGQVNGAYSPILFESEQQLLQVSAVLTENKIQHRRYFYPCLSECETYGEPVATPIASDISRRVLCLPLYYGLEINDVDKICALIRQGLK